MNVYHVWTDGCCLKNPGGAGGWAAIIVGPDGGEQILLGGCPSTTNNRMELLAAIRAIETLPAACQAVIHTDAQYLSDGVTKWMPAWKRHGWQRPRKLARKYGPIKNLSFWQVLDACTSTRDIEWRWVRGHNGEPFNERADALALQAALAAEHDVPRSEPVALSPVLVAG